MKKYFQSIAYITCLFAALYALHVALISYENPFDIYEKPIGIAHSYWSNLNGSDEGNCQHIFFRKVRKA